MVDYKLVKNEEKYFEFIRILRNSPELSDGFIDKTFISQEMQKKYMAKHKNEYYIALENETPVGFIGVVENDVRLAVEKKHQRKGVGSFMIRELLKIIPDFEVRVLPDNTASLKMFQKNGFKITGTTIKNKASVYILKRDDDKTSN